MWLWILKVIPGVGGFIKNYWKPILVVLAMLAVFLAGAKWEEAKYLEERATIAEANAKAIAERERVVRAEYAAQEELDAAARVELQTDLAALRARERSLIEGIRAAQLIKPTSDLVCEDVEVTEDATIIIANPFDPSFRELWNDASRAPTGDRAPSEE